jgi:hypothetical protein
MPAALSDFARRCDARVAGDKWPWYVDHLENTLAVFPDAKYVYNVRDPRGLWNSAQRFKGRGRGDELLDRMLENDRRLEGYLRRRNFLTIRYEDLVCRPEQTCAQLFGFLGCDFSPEHLFYSPHRDPYPERWEWVPEAGQQLDPWHTVKWKEQMSQQEIESVRRLAGWFIEKYGYEA